MMRTCIVAAVAMVASFLVASFALAMAGPAFAGSAASAAAEPALWDMLRPVIDAFMGREYWQGAAAAVILIAAAGRKYGSKLHPKLGGGAAGALYAFLAAFGAALLATLIDGAEMGWATVMTAGKLAGGAAAMYSVARAWLVPPLRRLADGMGGWRGSALSMLLWAFERPDKARDAGDKAVADNPGGGVTDISGDPIDIP